MAPFVYQEPTAPFAGSIADIIQRGGDMRAYYAQLAAQNQAQATAAKYGIWGNAINNAAQLPLLLSQQKRQDQLAQSQMALHAMDIAAKGQELQQRQQAVDDQQHFASTMQQLYPKFRKTDPDTGVTRTDWGGLNDAALQAGVNPTLMDAWMTKATAVEDAQDKRAAASRAERQNLLDISAQLAHDSEDFPTFARKVQGDDRLPADYKQQLLTNGQGADWKQFQSDRISVAPAVREYWAKLDKEAAEAEKDRAEATKPKTPPSMEQQYLEAVTGGNTAKAAAILGTIKATADAKKDPAMSLLAEQLKKTNLAEAQARLDALKEKAKDLDVSADIQTTTSGHTYLDLSKYTAAERGKAREAAGKLGAVTVSKEEASALADVDTARLNQRQIMDQIKDLLPSGALSRIAMLPGIKLSQVFKTNDQRAAFASWRTAAIQTLRATAGSKGLRINRSEIEQAIENDLPSLDDPASVALQKNKNINAMLDNAESPLVVRDRTQLVPAPATTGPPQPPALNDELQELQNRK